MTNRRVYEIEELNPFPLVRDLIMWSKWSLAAEQIIEERPMLDTWVHSVIEVVEVDHSLFLVFARDQRFFAESLLRFLDEITDTILDAVNPDMAQVDLMTIDMSCRALRLAQGISEM